MYRADSKTCRLDSALTGVCYRADVLFAQMHCWPDIFRHCRPDNIADSKTYQPDMSSTDTPYRADKELSSNHYRPNNLSEVVTVSAPMSG